MWKPFSDSSNVYMLRLEESENEFILLLTDLQALWKSKFSTLNLVDSFKKNNSLIEATDDQITCDLLEIINNVQKMQVSVNVMEDTVELSISKSCADFLDTVKDQKIIYKFILDKLDQNEFKHMITVPTIQTIYFLEKQQKMLLNLIRKKDRELEEFRMEKGDISRVDLRTEKFEANTLDANNEELLLNVFTTETSKEFWHKFTENNGAIQATNLHVELELWNMRPKRRVIHSGKKVVKKGSGVIFKK